MRLTIECFRHSENEIDIMVSDRENRKVYMRDCADNEKDMFTQVCKIQKQLWGSSDPCISGLDEVVVMLYDETEG